MENLTSDKVVELFKDYLNLDRVDFMDSILQATFEDEDELLAYLMSSLEVLLLDKGEDKMPLAKFLFSELLEELEKPK